MNRSKHSWVFVIKIYSHFKCCLAVDLIWSLTTKKNKVLVLSMVNILTTCGSGPSLHSWDTVFYKFSQFYLLYDDLIFFTSTKEVGFLYSLWSITYSTTHEKINPSFDPWDNDFMRKGSQTRTYFTRKHTDTICNNHHQNKECPDKLQMVYTSKHET